MIQGLPSTANPRPLCTKAADVWESAARLLLHPAKVAIIEALLDRSQPLSATRLRKLTGDEKAAYSFHLNELEKAGLLEKVETRKVRGTREIFFYFAK